MPKPADQKPKSLSDKDIVSAEKISRRSLLASTGISAALGVAAAATGTSRNAFAGDAKTLDADQKDPDKD